MHPRFRFVGGVAMMMALTAWRPAAAQEAAQASPPSALSEFTLTNQPLFESTGSAGAAAQRKARDPEAGFGFGIKAGPLFSTFNQDNPTAPFQNKTGFMGGIWFGGNRPGLVGVMGEVLYVRKGSTQTIGTETFDTDLYFIEIPVLVRVNVGTQSINKWVIYGIAGPAFDIKLKGKVNNIDLSDNYNGLNVDVVAGVGVELFRFLIEGRGNWGVRNVFKSGLGLDTKDRSFALLFGIRIS